MSFIATVAGSADCPINSVWTNALAHATAVVRESPQELDAYLIRAQAQSRLGQREGAIKTLQQKWEKVRIPWDDPVAREFESEFVAPLEGAVRNSVNAMEQMYDVLSKVKRDCE